jgi:aspartyl-tRNA(Asn)/glutamyl-tRNA(Gln) amidotransferase subunit B
LMNTAGTGFEALKVEPQSLADLLAMINAGKINPNTGKTVLADMFATGKPADEIVTTRGLAQVSNQDFIAQMVADVLAEYAGEAASYRAGKTSVANFLFGQAMRKAGGKANPQVLRSELEKQLQHTA